MKSKDAFPFVSGLLIGALGTLWGLPKAKKIAFERLVDYHLKEQPTSFAYHVFHKKALRHFLCEVVPESRPFLNDEMIGLIMNKLRLVNSVYMETVWHPPASDEDLLRYLEETGLLAEMALDAEEGLRRLRAIDPVPHVLEPKCDHTTYYSAAVPPQPVRLPAEFEPIGAVILAWPVYFPCRWKHHATFAAHIADQAEVHILAPNRTWQKGIELYLTQKSIPLGRVRFLHIVVDDLWTRDYGPTTVFCGRGNKPVIIANPYAPVSMPYHKRDAEAALEIGRYYGLPVYRLPIVMEGGNIVTDGQGVFVMFDSTLQNNPDLTRAGLEDLLSHYFGLKRLLLFPMLEREMTGHMDMVVKFADTETVLVAQSAVNHRWHTALEAIANQLAQTPSTSGKLYRVVRLPLGDHSNYTFNFWSYVNSLTLNRKVIMPLFGTEHDQTALEIYRAAMPNYEIVGVDFRDFPVGSVHCQSKEVPQALIKELD